MKLNCDLGEGFTEVDAQVMPYIDMANIACGGHTGDHNSMRKAVLLAKSHQVQIGAHPSYPDKPNFGRQPFHISPPDLFISLRHQITNLQFICAEHHAALTYIKPHGQLYHDCVYNESIRTTLLEIAQHFELPLMLMTTSKNSVVSGHAQKAKVNIIFEAFADRSYNDAGCLVARSKEYAVHKDIETIQKQAQNFIHKNGTYSNQNTWLDLSADSLCVHGDTVGAMTAIKVIRALTIKNN